MEWQFLYTGFSDCCVYCAVVTLVLIITVMKMQNTLPFAAGTDSCRGFDRGIWYQRCSDHFWNFVNLFSDCSAMSRRNERCHSAMRHCDGWPPSSRKDLHCTETDPLPELDRHWHQRWIHQGKWSMFMWREKCIFVSYYNNNWLPVFEMCPLLAVFNVGQYRREATDHYRNHEFFKQDNKEAMEIREYVDLCSLQCSCSWAENHTLLSVDNMK